MKNYLMSKGISEDKILLEDKSTTTYENMKFSKEVIDKDVAALDNLEADVDEGVNIAFSTTSYHVFRSGNIKKNHITNALFVLLLCLMVCVLYFMI